MVGSPVASAKRIAGRPDWPFEPCGCVANSGLLHEPTGRTVTVAVLHWSLPQALTISTQYDFVLVSGGVVNVPVVAPGAALLLSPFCPSYHWIDNGCVPFACTVMVKVW